MTIKEALEKGRKALLNKGDSPFLDCRLLVSHVTNLSFSSLITMEEKVLSSKEEELFNRLLEKRINHVPMAYILGKKNFFGYDFLTPGNVLIPRPDTEILIESAISDICNSYKNRVSILDLCSGSGCIGITLALELNKKGFKVNLTLTDISPEAVEVSLNNCHLLLKDHDIEYKVLQGDLFSALSNEKFNVIATNPPYIKRDVISTLDEDVKYEPLLALDGGEDGLTIIKTIIKTAPLFLEKNGNLFMEIGYDQKEEVSTLFKENGFEKVDVIKDLGGRDRVVKGFLK